MVRFGSVVCFALVLFGFPDAWFGLVLWMCDVVSEIREICVMWMGWDFVLLWWGFLCSCLEWYGLIRFGSVVLFCISFIRVL